MNLYYCFNKRFHLLFLVFAMQISAQTYSITEIDSLQIKESKRLKKIGRHKESILLDKNLIKASQNLHYNKGVIRGYINIANALCTLNKYQESLSYLSLAEKKIVEYEDNMLKSRLYREYGRNYSQLGLYRQSNVNFDKAIKFAKQIDNKKEREGQLYFSYAWKLGSFDKMNMIDSVNEMQRKCMSLSPEPLLFVSISERHLKNKKPDSAEFYLRKASLLSEKYPIYQKSIILRSYGKLYTEKKEYEKSLTYYFQSLAISQKINRQEDIRDIYKLIYNTYGLLNNTVKKNEYLEKYTVINDSLTLAEKEAINIPLEKISNEKDEAEKSRNSLYYILAGIIFTIVLLMIIRHRYATKQKQNFTIKREEETLNLSEKPNITFEEVVELAIHSSPLFLTKFKELYPEFYDNLALQCPQLTSNDIRFCALIKLNFSNKEIAQYDHISIRTVESKKYRLRKKLGLLADLDFNKWIMQQ